MNNSLNIALLDDDIKTTRVIQASLIAFFESNKVDFKLTIFNSPKTFLNRSKEIYFDLLLCDIEMGEEDGISVCIEFKKRTPQSQIIFLSNREDKVFESLKAHPFGFIRKKSFLSDVSILKEYLNKYKNEQVQDLLIIQQSNDVINITINEIVYISSERKSQRIHLNDGETIEITSTLQQLDSQLNTKGFFQIHQKHLVNLSYIKRIKNNTIILKNDTTLPISRRRLNDVKNAFLHLMQKENNVLI